MLFTQYFSFAAHCVALSSVKNSWPQSHFCPHNIARDYYVIIDICNDTGVTALGLKAVKGDAMKICILVVAC